MLPPMFCTAMMESGRLLASRRPSMKMGTSRETRNTKMGTSLVACMEWLLRALGAERWRICLWMMLESSDRVASPLAASTPGRSATPSAAASVGSSASASGLLATVYSCPGSCSCRSSRRSAPTSKASLTARAFAGSRTSCGASHTASPSYQVAVGGTTVWRMARDSSAPSCARKASRRRSASASTPAAVTPALLPKRRACSCAMRCLPFSLSWPWRPTASPIACVMSLSSAASESTRCRQCALRACASTPSQFRSYWWRYTSCSARSATRLSSSTRSVSSGAMPGA
mmetsp:Transcript_14116/g.36561  ORF Transcript_14116/g.36561 Transcript_14116/m.36561 type:complete len:287 (-) Transcript_14116:1821-2681(-)